MNKRSLQIYGLGVYLYSDLISKSYSTTFKSHIVQFFRVLYKNHWSVLIGNVFQKNLLPLQQEIKPKEKEVPVRH